MKLNNAQDAAVDAKNVQVVTTVHNVHHLHTHSLTQATMLNHAEIYAHQDTTLTMLEETAFLAEIAIVQTVFQQQLVGDAKRAILEAEINVSTVVQ